MYAHHFGLSQDPFSIAPDPRYLFMSERHREALAHLLFGVSGGKQALGGGFVLLTGEIGSGKTTICRCFLEQIPPNCQVAYIFNPKLSVIDLLQSICEEFHIKLSAHTICEPTVKGYIDALNAFLLQRHAEGQSCVLIIDEAQNLASDVLEQLRLLTNLETNQRKLLQIVLIGQPELRDLLARPELEQLAQRVIARFHLEALGAAETRHYISHRLAVAGHTGALPFAPAVLQQIYHLTGGVPRRINLLCGRAMLGAWANGQQHISRQGLSQAAAEVFGNYPKPAISAARQRLDYVLAGLTLCALAWAGSLLPWPLSTSMVQLAPVAASRPAASPPQVATSKQKSPVTKTDKAVYAPKTVAVSLPIEDLHTLWPALRRTSRSAWRELASAWPPGSPAMPPCESKANRIVQPASAGLDWQCFHAKQVTLPLLRQLNRPGVLTLQTGQAQTALAVLVGLNDQTATLQMAGRLHQVRLLGLMQFWRGEFATYWQPPAGYSANLTKDSGGAAIQWLMQRLSQLDAAAWVSNPSPVLDAALRARVRAFQRSRGLISDGLPGPMTFIQLDSATNRQMPRLMLTPTD